MKDAGLVAFTDESGSYRLTNVPARLVVLEVFYTGMEPQQIPVNLAGVTSAERDISRRWRGSIVPPGGTAPATRPRNAAPSPLHS